MESTLIALLLKPFAALVLFCALALVRVWLIRVLPEGSIKRVLLLRLK